MFTSLRMKVLAGLPQWRQSDLISLRDFQCRSEFLWQYPRALKAVASSTGIGNRDEVQSQSKSAARKSARIEASEDQRKASAATVIDTNTEYELSLCCLASKRCPPTAAAKNEHAPYRQAHQHFYQMWSWIRWASTQQSLVPCGRLA